MNLEITKEMAEIIIIGINAAEFECLIDYNDDVNKIISAILKSYPELKEHYTPLQLEEMVK